MARFTQRAMRKAREHLQRDPTGLSLIKYSWKWSWGRVGRLHRARTSHRPPAGGFTLPEDRVVVCVKVTGGVGDYVIIARVLRDLSAASENLRFHVFCPAPVSGQWAFWQLSAVEAVYDEVFFHEARRDYDCALYLNQLAWYDEDDVNFRKISRLTPAFAKSLAACRVARRQWHVYIEHHPTLDGALAHCVTALGMNRYSFLFQQLGLETGPVELDLPCEYDLADELAGRFPQWITLNNGFDANFVISARQSTKCYPITLWERVVEGVKRECPDVAVVQIGAKTSLPVEAADVNLVGRTTLAQAAGLIRRARLHVDIEGGLVHVAASFGTRSVVLFGPTSMPYFAYPENINVSSGFCGNCWWTTERWMESCPRNYGSARCMDDLPPEKVIEAITTELRTEAPPRPSLPEAPKPASTWEFAPRRG